MAEHDHEHEHQQQVPQGEPSGVREPAFEPRDANVRAIVRFGIGLVVYLIVVMLVLLGTYSTLTRHEKEPAEAHPRPLNLTEQLKQLHADEDAALGGYSKLDNEPGFARIPIDRAMDLVAKKGVPFGKGRKTDVQINTRVKQ